MHNTATTAAYRPQRTLTPEENEKVRATSALNFQGALLMGLVDPVPNSSPMSEDEGEWVREQVWPEHLKETERRYPFGFHRWSTCERGTCRNCLSGRCDLCVHRQRGGPHVDDNTDWVYGPRGRCLAQLVLRPDDAPCVWWCRCPCPKNTPTTTPPPKLPAGHRTSPETERQLRQRDANAARARTGEGQDLLF